MELTMRKDVNPEADFKIRKANQGESWVLIYKDSTICSLNYEEKEAMISLLSQAAAYYNFMAGNIPVSNNRDEITDNPDDIRGVF